jgi:hypothetical protein
MEIVLINLQKLLGQPSPWCTSFESGLAGSIVAPHEPTVVNVQKSEIHGRQKGFGKLIQNSMA